MADPIPTYEGRFPARPRPYREGSLAGPKCVIAAEQPAITDIGRLSCGLGHHKCGEIPTLPGENGIPATLAWTGWLTLRKNYNHMNGETTMKKTYQAPALTKRQPLAQVAATVKAISLFQVQPMN